MFRAFCLGLLVPVLACAQAAAQARPVSLAAQPAITLGESAIPLPGPWRFIPGDSPLSNDRYAYSMPSYDDSSWSVMDLQSDDASDPSYGSSGYLKGWTARGFPGLAGFAWYRLRIHLQATSAPIAIKMPDHEEDAYQVFANGVPIGTFGDFSTSHVISYRSRPLTFTLPPSDSNGDIVLAIRFFAEPANIITGNTPDAGGMHEVPILAVPATADQIRSQEVRARILAEMVPGFVDFILFIAALGAISLWWLDRSQSAYLWLALAFSGVALGSVFDIASLFSYLINQQIAQFLTICGGIASIVFWNLFWREWFGVPLTRSFQLLLLSLGLADVGCNFFSFLYSATTYSAGLHFLQIAAVLNLILGVLILIPVVHGERKDRTAALLTLPSILLLEVTTFATPLLTWFRIRTAYFPAGIAVDVNQIASVVLVLVVGALVARRFLGSQVAQNLARQVIDQDLEQASVLQQSVLMPEPVCSPHFQVETAYHPARTVGGDFFQIVTHPDGSLLIVLGDVSGKGVAAAMLVSVLVGAIRTEAAHTSSPAAILNTLNARMIGRAGGHFATCIAAHLLPDGTLHLANAGHLPPYINGRALDMEGSLPLGLDSDARYTGQTIYLDPEDRLVLLTDGVLEARNLAGHLLGFDATEALTNASPNAIAHAAITHGQDDDITIVSITLQPALAVQA